MRLVLTLPEGWIQHPIAAGTARENEALNLCGPSAMPRLRLSYGPLVPVPLDGEGYIMRVLGEDLPPAAQLVIQRRMPNQTVTGYPMLIVSSVIKDAAGRILEARFTAFYSMLSTNAAAVLRAPSSDDRSESGSDLLNQYEEAVKTIFRSATPDWEAGVCTLSALYDGLPALWERK